jgi:hypothetical protein
VLLGCRERLVECYSAGEVKRLIPHGVHGLTASNQPVGNTVYSPIVALLAERIDYEVPIQKSYMHQGYSFNYLVNEEGLCFMAVAKAEFQTRICFAFLARVVNE